MRFIPTPVGSMDDVQLIRWTASVHPHACGEYSSILAIHPVWYGSSPRLWGVSLEDASEDQQIRFIPTPVGSMFTEAADTMLLAVHPHACGEYICLPPRHFSLVGSSPRLWGVSSAVTLRPLVLRFIPTPVGSMPSPDCHIP